MTRVTSRHDRSAAARRSRTLAAALAAPGAVPRCPRRCRPTSAGGSTPSARASTTPRNIRTVFWNYGMVGDYPADPGNVDLSVFHSVEVPKGSGMNYCDGITPFVLAKIKTARRRRRLHHGDRLPRTAGHQPVLQPRSCASSRGPATSSRIRTSTAAAPRRSATIRAPGRSSWPDKARRSRRSGLAGTAGTATSASAPAADQESFTVMDDDYYDAWDFYPDTPRSTAPRARPARRGARVPVGEPAGRQRDLLALRHHQRGHDRLRRQHHLRALHGLGRRRLRALVRRDLRVRRRQRLLRPQRPATQPRLHLGQERARPRPDRELRQDRLPGLRLSRDARATRSTASTTTTTASPTKRRDGGPGKQIVGQAAIRAYVVRALRHRRSSRPATGRSTNRPAYRVGRWWTGDEDMDWVAEVNDVGADGVQGHARHGRGRRDPHRGRAQLRPHRPQRVRPDRAHRLQDEPDPRGRGQSRPDHRRHRVLHRQTATGRSGSTQKFTDPDPAGALRLGAGGELQHRRSSSPRGRSSSRRARRERFSLALAYGADLAELRENVRTVQQIYNANYQFAVPPRDADRHGGGRRRLRAALVGRRRPNAASTR